MAAFPSPRVPDRTPEVVLKPGRDRSVRRRHPWVLSGAIDRVGGEPAAGSWVRVVSAQGEPLGVGHYSPASQIRVRLLRFGQEDADDEFIAARVAEAVERRRRDPLLDDTESVRLVNAEGDGLPGLLVDRYADVVVVRLASAGMVERRALVAEALRKATDASTGFERPDATAARREGVAARQGPLWGTPPAEPVPIHERSRRYFVDVVGGQKTGFYLDQRDARDLVERVAEGRRLLDLFAYSGGFAVAAAQGGARAVTLVDSSADALALAERHLEPYAAALAVRRVRADAFRFVRGDASRYDLLVIDPPPLARRPSDVARAARAYKDVIVHALRRAEPGALVLAFSCSHHVGSELFRKIVFGASLDAQRPLRVLRELGAPADHPVSLDHPEGRYLTGLLLAA